MITVSSCRQAYAPSWCLTQDYWLFAYAYVATGGHAECLQIFMCIQ